MNDQNILEGMPALPVATETSFCFLWLPAAGGDGAASEIRAA